MRNEWRVSMIMGLANRRKGRQRCKKNRIKIDRSSNYVSGGRLDRMTIRNFAFVGVVCGESIIINKLPTRKTCGRQGGTLLANVYYYSMRYYMFMNLVEASV